MRGCARAHARMCGGVLDRHAPEYYSAQSKITFIYWLKKLLFADALDGVSHFRSICQVLLPPPPPTRQRPRKDNTILFILCLVRRRCQNVHLSHPRAFDPSQSEAINKKKQLHFCTAIEENTNAINKSIIIVRSGFQFNLKRRRRHKQYDFPPSLRPADCKSIGRPLSGGNRTLEHRPRR